MCRLVSALVFNNTLMHKASTYLFPFRSMMLLMSGMTHFA